MILTHVHKKHCIPKALPYHATPFCSFLPNDTKKNHSVFLIGWNPPKASAAIIPATARPIEFQRKHTQFGKKNKAGAEGRGRQGHYHKATPSTMQKLSPSKRTFYKIAEIAGKCPLQEFVCACNISTQPLSHSCSCHSCHKTSIFPHFLRIRAGWGNMFHNPGCCPHCLPRKTAGTGSTLYHCLFVVWKVCK